MQFANGKWFAGAIAAIVATACLGFGSWGSHKSPERGANVVFATATKLRNGAVLPAGTYRMEVADNSQNPEVKFYKEDATTQDWGGNPIAMTHAKLISQPEKNRHTEIDSVQRGADQLLQVVRPRGWNEQLALRVEQRQHQSQLTPSHQAKQPLERPKRPLLLFQEFCRGAQFLRYW